MTEKRVFRSLMEVEKFLFPKAFEKKIKEQKRKNGTGLAEEFLEKLREALHEKKF